MTGPRKFPELIFGLVGAVGSDLSAFGKILSEELRTVGYDSISVRLSSLISQCYDWRHLQDLSDSPEDERINEHMNAGDDIRRLMRRGDAVALLAMSYIRDIREEKSGNTDTPLHKHAFILNSLKHPDEIKTLRKIYGESFVVLSLYSPKNKRIERLSSLIAESRHRFSDLEYKNKAKFLADKDENEVGDDYGQNVRDTFPLADVFFSNNDQLRNSVNRFIKLFFGYPFTTPTIDEFGIYMARAAALRSSDLSRQVGAVIMTQEGSVIAAGCNEVPKADGGAVWEGSVEEDKDYRDFRTGRDANAVMKYENIREMFNILKENNLLNTEKTPDELTQESLNDKKNPYLKEARIANIIEFGRVVHAEMHAISDAAARGIPVKGATLYCTTFPCHMCARHIVSCGIKRVVYVDPYPKSMTKDLYKRSVCIDGDDSDSDAVYFDSFVGISPIRYSTLFYFEKRKNSEGYADKWDVSQAFPKLENAIQIYFGEEFGVVSFLNDYKDHLIGPDENEEKGGSDDRQGLVEPSNRDGDGTDEHA